MSSVTAVPLQPVAPGTVRRLWLGLILLGAIAFAFAWMSTRPLVGTTLASGVKVQTLKAGQGPKMGLKDGAAIEYEGRLPDGTVFDSTAGRGPAPMLRMGVIPGFAEALGEMQEGGKYRIRIPAKLGYGATPPPGSPIPANSDLSFDVEIVKLVPNAATMMQQQMMQQGPDGAMPEGGAAPAPGGSRR